MFHKPFLFMLLAMHSFLKIRAILAFLGLLFAVSLSLSPNLIAAPALQTTTCQNAPLNADPTASVCISRVVVPFNGISPDNQFYVSWRSQTAVKGQVKLSTGATFDDVRGANYQGITHYIAVSNLDAKKNYTFDILNGGETFTNNGAHWSVKMGPALQSNNPYTILGRVKNPDGSDADGAIVFAQIRDGDDQGTPGRSAHLSALISVADGGNFFTIDLDQARTQNQSQKYAFNPETDRVQIIAVGAQGTASKTFQINALHPPAPAPTLTLSGSGAGNAATATPTSVPPTITQTFTPSPTATQTLTPTLTQTFAPPTRTRVPPSATPLLIPTIANPIPTLAPDEATRIAETPIVTSVANPAGEEVEPQRTRVFGGVPSVISPPAQNNNVLFIVLAVVLFVGALLLGAAAFFVSRR